MPLPTIVFDPALDPTEPVEHRLIWATDLIGTRDRHEQRRSLRRLPRQTLQFAVDTVDAAEMARLDALLQAGSPDGFKVPMWCDRLPLVAPVSSGATALGLTSAGGQPAGPNWKGVWSSATSYVPNDIISFSGSGYVAYSKTLNDQPGWQAKSNPEFASGTSTYAVYDNGTSGSITLTTEADAAAPNSTGVRMKVAHSTAGSPTPGFGGFVSIINESGAGFAYTTDTYRRGQVTLFVLVANIPIGYTLNRASNGVGTGNDVNGDAANPAVWLTSQAGTGDWFTYIAELRSGTVTPWSTTGHYYITGPSRPFNWYVAIENVITPWRLDNNVTGYDYINGDQIIFYQNSRSYELATINFVTDGVITFPGLANTWPAGTLVAPIKYGYLLGPVSPSRTFRDGQSSTVAFVLR